MVTFLVLELEECGAMVSTLTTPTLSVGRTMEETQACYILTKTYVAFIIPSM